MRRKKTDPKNVKIKNAVWTLKARAEADEAIVPSLRLGRTGIRWPDATQKNILKVMAQERQVKQTPHEQRMTSRHNISDDEWKEEAPVFVGEDDE